MRVIAGKARSLPLKAPEGLDTRPTTDRIKETLFNILQPDLYDCVFIDLFSGSGAIGIEALSRGARRAYFVENAPKAISCIQDNLAFTKFTDCGIVIKQDVIAGLNNIREEHADIIFLDPPYQREFEKKVLLALNTAPYVDDETLIVVEADLKTDFSWLAGSGYRLVKEKIYKTNKHMFIRRS